MGVIGLFIYMVNFKIEKELRKGGISSYNKRKFYDRVGLGDSGSGYVIFYLGGVGYV